MDHHAKAKELFDSKITNVLKVVDFRAQRTSLRAADLDDLRQTASMVLWQQCLRSVDPAVKPFEINCRLVAVSGWGRWVSPRRRHRRTVTETDAAGRCEAGSGYEGSRYEEGSRYREGSRYEEGQPSRYEEGQPSRYVRGRGSA